MFRLHKFLFTHVCNFYDFSEKRILTFTLTTRRKVIFERNKLTIVKVETSHFRMRLNKSMYDSFSRNYIYQIIDNFSLSLVQLHTSL